MWRRIGIVSIAAGLLLAACAGVSPGVTRTPETTSTPEPECENPFEGETVRFSTRFWEETNFCKHSVPYGEIVSGGPPPDGIPSIDEPKFDSVAVADEWLGDEWPVMVLHADQQVKAYPLSILLYHEIVNDTVAEMPVAVTYCPLCNSALVFSRRLPDGSVAEFGTTGNLRNADLIMYDRKSQSWWQQLTGEAIVGRYTGSQLEILASQIVPWEKLKRTYADAQVLSRDTGYARDYGQNPYRGLDTRARPFLFGGNPDDRLPAMERIASASINDVSVAYPFSALRERPVINDEVGGVPIVIIWQPGTKSVLDSANVDAGRDVGSAAIFKRRVDDQVLTFEAAGEDRFGDQQTGSQWNLFGEAIQGPLEGTRLEQVVSGEHFWFAWAAFKPETEVRTGDAG